MEFYSHLEPNKIFLKDHLQYVGNRSKKIVDSKEFNEIDKKTLVDISYLIGISHDFGKYTTFFQEKLKGLKDKNDPLTYHGLISALFTFEVVNKYIKKKKLEDKKPYKFLPLFAYFVVKHHHGNLDDIGNDIDGDILFERGFCKISKQLKDIWINKNKIKEEYNFLLQNYNISIEEIFGYLEKYMTSINYSKEIKFLIEGLDKTLYFFRKNNKDIIYYLLVQFFYSVLIDSDKKHAGQIREIKSKDLSENLVEDYLKKEVFKEKNKSNINYIRNEIRETVLRNIKNPRNITQKIFTLTAPTGTGKTLISFSAALLLRKILKNTYNLRCESHIIYSLPFTSIIDQNYSVFDKVLKQIEDFKVYENEYLLKHHYLSEIFYKTKDIDKEKDVDESLALIESWESEIVVTTFIQLFYTLIGYKNRSLKKFHNIVNSIFILDEVQNIPIKYWNLIREVLLGMAKYFNCRVVLMTATKPLIFQEGEYKELVDDYEKYFEKTELNRVCLQINSNIKQEIIDFYKCLNDWSKNSYLFVFNTIGSSLEFYNLLSEGKFEETEMVILYKGKKEKKKINKIIKNNHKYDLYYLSTNIIPKARKERIDIIKNRLENNKKVIIISTQLIEAGVDIDCECIYRDIGPLDSIIQVLGRCNRNKKFEQGEAHVINLITINKRNVADDYANIYDKVLLNLVRELFKDKKLIYERDFLGLINDYFKNAKRKSSMETKLLKSLYELYFDDIPDSDKRIPISEFKLIENEYYKTDVFVELDLKSQETYKRYQEIRIIKSSFERKNEFLKIKKNFYDYVISVPYQYAGDFVTEDEGIDHISLEEIKQNNYYDLETGFKREKQSGGGVLIY
jgi:CRISPR-associated endonuclease/helicase Cas3